jgi:multiple sugar transport system ATP-binding protein
VAPALAGPGACLAQVALLEPVGSDTFVELDIRGSRVVVRASPDVRFSIGETVALEVAVEKVHLFDPGTEDRLEP